MYDLFSFYRSREWNGLLAQLKQERLDASGNIICEYCGKPIVRAYDCIGHHKEELTEDNVNNYEISLNPTNIALVHHRCHNYIHNKLGYQYREVFLVYGAPLSGKTSWVSMVKNDGDLIIDLDNIWQCVSGCDRYIKPPRLNAIVFGLRDKLLEMIKYRIGKWQCAYIIGGYPLQGERERLCKELGAREVFIECDKKECEARLLCLDDNDIRKKQKENWWKYIEEWFTRYSPPG